MTWHKYGLLAALVLSEVFYLSLLKLDAINGARPVATFLCILAALFSLYGFAFKCASSSKRFSMLLIWTGAVLFRITLIPAGLPQTDGISAIPQMLHSDVQGEAVVFEPFLLFDSDIWRYLWDGHTAANGFNPYEMAPSNPALDGIAGEQWTDIRDNINHPDIPTIYAPLAQGAFRVAHAIAPGSIAVIKLLFVAFDLLVIVFLYFTLKSLGRSGSEVILYAWNPLVIKVIAGSGHFDSLVALCLAATFYFLLRARKIPAAFAFGFAVLARIVPVLLLPFVARRAGWKGVAATIVVIVAGCIPFMEGGIGTFVGLGIFSRNWEFNSGPYTLLQWFTGSESGARILALLLELAVVAAIVSFDRKKDATSAAPAAMALGAAILLSPVVMPWYIVWVLPAAILSGQKIWIYFSAIVCLAFFVMIDGTLPALVLWIEYGAFAIFFCFEFFQGVDNENKQDPDSPGALAGDVSRQLLHGPGQRIQPDHQRL